ncbi:MAG: Bax inhibitor-1/YccA family protein, partial [Chloroflexi bacterium]|nr:Bax inhibitor-1/YccA family protein [Chloroflexota bacterium]
PGGPCAPGGGYGQPGGLAAPASVAVQGSFLTQAFFWMFAGLLLSAAIATVVQFNQQLVDFAASNFLILIIAQLGLVLAIGFLINRISATLALGLFFVYAASLGLTIGLIVMAYQAASVVTAFLSASAMFGGAALFGAVTKRNLAGIGSIAMMALFGLIAAIIVNLFVGSSTISWIISLAGVAIFTALTAWDVQRINSGQLVAMTGSVEKAAVLGALHLYLDFVNLFLFLLRLFGDRR